MADFELPAPVPGIPSKVPEEILSVLTKQPNPGMFGGIEYALVLLHDAGLIRWGDE